MQRLRSMDCVRRVQRRLIFKHPNSTLSEAALIDRVISIKIEDKVFLQRQHSAVVVGRLDPTDLLTRIPDVTNVHGITHSYASIELPHALQTSHVS